MANDRAAAVLGYVVESLRTMFDPKSATPALGGGTPHIRLFGGDSLPVAAWNGFRDDTDCAQPLVWVRLVRRYRTELLPEESGRTTTGCKRPKAMTVEAGVMRCAVVDAEPAWSDYEREALVQLDDSERIDWALCRAMSCAENEGRALSTYLAAGEPWGPNGGVIAWTQWAHLQLAG